MGGRGACRKARTSLTCLTSLVCRCASCLPYGRLSAPSARTTPGTPPDLPAFDSPGERVPAPLAPPGQGEMACLGTAPRHGTLATGQWRLLLPLVASCLAS